MKKLLIGILCLLTVTFTAFGLIGCNKNNGASTTESTSVESTSTSQSEKESSSESNVESNSNGCAHTLDVLKKDGDYHWYVCICGETSGNREAHNYDEGVVTKQPTEEKEGEKLLTCTTCGETATVSIPKADHVHALVKNSGTPASCTEDGTKDSWSCTGCKKVYFDAQATQEVVSEASLP